MNRKRIVLLAILTAALAVVIILTVVVMQPLPEEQRELIEVSDVPPATVQAMNIVSGDSTITVMRQGEGWQAMGSDINVDSLTCEGMATYLGYVYAVDVIEEKPDDIGNYGLDEPSLVAEIVLSDGTNIVYVFGLPTADQSAMYFMKSGDDKLYTMLEAHFAQIRSTLEDIVDLSLPAIDSDSMSRIEYRMGSVSHAVAASDMAESGFVFEETNTAASGAFITQVQKAVTSRLAAYVGEEADVVYGLDGGDYIRVTDAGGKTLGITLGSKTEDGKYYCIVDGKQGVYLAFDDITDFILDDVYLCMDRRMIPAAQDDIVSITLTGEGREINLDAATGVLTVNGEQKSHEEFGALYSQLLAVTASGVIDKPADEQASYTVAVQLKNGQTITVGLHAYLKGFYALSYGSEPSLFVKADMLNNILSWK